MPLANEFDFRHDGPSGPALVPPVLDVLPSGTDSSWFDYPVMVSEPYEEKSYGGDILAVEVTALRAVQHALR